MKTKIVLLFMLLLLTTEFIYAQTAPDTLWTKTFGGAANDQAVAIRQTGDGGYIVLGSTESFGNGQIDTWLVKIDENGNETWNKTYGGSANDGAVSIECTNDNGFIFTGLTESYGNGGQDFWLVKTDSNGTELWDKTFGGSADDRAHYVIQTSDEGFLITGGTYSFSDGHSDVWFIKTDENGNEVWNRTYGGSGNEKAYSVHQTPDGGYILAGFTDPARNFKYDIYLIKTDENGYEIWSRTFGGSDIENAYSCELTDDGGYILAGYTKSFGNGQSDIWLIKTDANGNEVWNKTFGGTGVDYTYSAQQTTDGGYIVGGFTDSEGNGGFDIWIIKTDENGNEVWNKTIGEASDEFCFFVQQTFDGGYITAGSTNFIGNGDFYVVKLAADATSVFHDRVVPITTNLKANYPNPFNAETTFSFEIGKPTNITLKIYNVLGNIVQTVIDNKSFNEGYFSIKFDAGSLASGIYFYKLSSNDGYTKMEKMCFIK